MSFELFILNFLELGYEVVFFVHVVRENRKVSPKSKTSFTSVHKGSHDANYFATSSALSFPIDV